MGRTGTRNPKYALQDQLEVVQLDWDGKIVWKFDQAEFVEDPGSESRWVARQHHDFQREGNPVGYYAPGLEPKIDTGNSLVLSRKDVNCSYIGDKPLLAQGARYAQEKSLESREKLLCKNIASPCRQEAFRCDLCALSEAGGSFPEMSTGSEPYRK
jgi:hypothetical protein